MNNFVTHLECSEAGDHYNFAEINNLSKINKPLLVKYDLEKLKNSFQKKIYINDFSKKINKAELEKKKKWNNQWKKTNFCFITFIIFRFRSSSRRKIYKFSNIR